MQIRSIPTIRTFSSPLSPVLLPWITPIKRNRLITGRFFHHFPRFLHSPHHHPQFEPRGTIIPEKRVPGIPKNCIASERVGKQVRNYEVEKVQRKKYYSSRSLSHITTTTMDSSGKKPDYYANLPAPPEPGTPLLKEDVTVALIQLASGSNKAANLQNAREKVLAAAKEGGNIVVLPECFNSPYGTQYFDQYAEVLTPSPPSSDQSPSFAALSAMAKEAGVYLVGGSIPERESDSELQKRLSSSSSSSSPQTNEDDKKSRLYNTSLIFSPTGTLLSTHRKIHLFDIDIPHKIRFKESEVLSPGSHLTILDFPPYGRVAVAICYDIRFPELATIAARRGAFLLLYPGAFNLTTGALHWELQARARAMDNQVFVGLCSPARDMGATYHAWGHSMLVRPNAEVLGSLEEKEGTLIKKLEAGRIEEVRSGIPIVTQRRWDVYPDVSGVYGR